MIFSTIFHREELMPRKQRALVVNPFVIDFKLYDEWMHPVGLYFLIDALVANGIDVRFFDCLERPAATTPRKYGTGIFNDRETAKPVCFNDIKRKYKCYGCSNERFRAFLISLPPPDVVFVGSMMTYWADGVIETIRQIREVFPAVPVVCGGIAARLMPDYFRQRVPGIHVFERSILDSDDTISLPGLTRPLSVPVAPSLLPGLKMAVPRYHGPLLLSFGCPMHCSYCASKVLQPDCRKRPIKAVQEELGFLIRHGGIRDFAFYDDALLLHARSLLVPLLDWIAENRLPVRLHTPNGLHLKYATEPLLTLMRDTGFTTLRFGYESGDSRHHHQTGGKADRHLLAEKLSLLQQLHFPDTGVYVMGGLPGSRPAEMIDEMRFISSFGVAVKPVFLSPVPGTPLFLEYAKQFPEILSDSHWHNDTFFITRLPLWGEENVEIIRQCARELNRGIKPQAA